MWRGTSWSSFIFLLEQSNRETWQLSLGPCVLANIHVYTLHILAGCVYVQTVGVYMFMFANKAVFHHRLERWCLKNPFHCHFIEHNFKETKCVKVKLALINIKTFYFGGINYQQMLLDIFQNHWKINWKHIYRFSARIVSFSMV